MKACQFNLFKITELLHLKFPSKEGIHFSREIKFRKWKSIDITRARSFAVFSQSLFASRLPSVYPFLTVTHTSLVVYAHIKGFSKQTIPDIATVKTPKHSK